MSAFDEWYDGLVGFHVNSERMLDDLMPVENPGIDPVKMRKWMVVCWNEALEAAQSLPCVAWDDVVHGHIENLKEKP
jgi:hypothetical protein